MDELLETAVSAIPRSRKFSARVALVDLKESTGKVLRDCFKQFGIETLVVTDNAVERLPREKFEACVLKLSTGAELVMDSVRRSASNGKMVIYGLGGSAQEAMQYSKYGINAVFHEPVQRPAVLKVVRVTQMLVAHEFRRYLRIPVITEISVVTADNRRFTAISQEVSSGGMSIKSDEEVPLDQALEISFGRAWNSRPLPSTRPQSGYSVLCMRE